MVATGAFDAIDRAAAIIDALAERGACGVTDLARAVDLSPATTQRYVKALAAHRFLERVEPGPRYVLGVRLFELGHIAIRREVREVARPLMRRLVDQWEETANLAARHEKLLVLIDAVETTRPLRMGARVGERDNWHASALGKAILAHLPLTEVENILSGVPMMRLTSRTRTTIPEFLKDLEVVRERGFAVDDREADDGLRCVGAPIFGPDQTPIYALSLSGPVGRMTEDRVNEMGAQLIEAANTVFREISREEAGINRWSPLSARAQDPKKNH